MDDEYIMSNKLTNLIPIVNSGLQGEYGIRMALLYRILPCIEIDSSDIVKDAFIKFYGKNIPESSDTILNAFIPFLDFCRAKLIIKKYRVPKVQKELLELIYLRLRAHLWVKSSPTPCLF